MRVPHAQVVRRQAEVRQLINQRLNKSQIIQVIKERGYPHFSPRTYDNDLQALERENLEWIRGQAKGAFVTDYRTALDSMRLQIQQHQLVRDRATKAADAAQNPMAKAALLGEATKATNSITETEALITDLIAKGPAVFGVKAQDDQVQ